LEPERLKKFTENIFKKIGCSASHARLAADVLIQADLSGVDSHGTARLPGYVRLYDHGRLNPKPKIKIIHQTPSTATIDGDKGLGLVVAPEAMKIAIKKAKRAGTGWVAIRNSNHFGIAGYHALLAIPQEMIGWSMTHAAPLVVPTFSKEKLLGTNPIAVAIPAGDEPTFLADFASTAVAYGKLEILQRKNMPVPPGWVQDAAGIVSDDPHAVQKGGGLLPLGGDRERGSHKGYGLGAIVDIFSGVLSGANYGPWVPPFATAGFHDVSAEQVGIGTGHFVGAMCIDAFRPADEFKQHMDTWIKRFRSAEAIEGQTVQIPGDQERNFKAERLKNGIPLNEKVIENLSVLSERFKVKI
jgi:L-2-hydroxycarboxylate dehydrogenase (NAD+)